MSNNFKRNPTNLSDIILPKKLAVIRESLAKNTHEEWARARMENS